MSWGHGPWMPKHIVWVISGGEERSEFAFHIDNTNLACFGWSGSGQCGAVQSYLKHYHRSDWCNGMHEGGKVKPHKPHTCDACTHSMYLVGAATGILSRRLRLRCGVKFYLEKAGWICWGLSVGDGRMSWCINVARGEVGSQILHCMTVIVIYAWRDNI